MADLGTLGGSDSFGQAINASGQVAGNTQTVGNSTFHAFLYTGTPGSDGVMTDLGTLGGPNSRGDAINDAGQVAGWSTTPVGDHAFLYTGTPGADGHMIDLDAWLDATNPIDGAKWTLRDALGLSDSGLITGYGDYSDGPGGLSDGTRAFLLDASSLLVPEPSTFALAALGAAALYVVKRV
jgi:probable HAF family extracellular repeat protein